MVKSKQRQIEWNMRKAAWQKGESRISPIVSREVKIVVRWGASQVVWEEVLLPLQRVFYG